MQEQKEETYQRFRTTGQSMLKLDCALKGYFDLKEEDPLRKKAYEDYLRLRSRPASELLIRQDETEKLKRIHELNKFTEQQLMKLIEIAGQEGKLSSLAWLLRLKKEEYGYRDKDFSL